MGGFETELAYSNSLVSSNKDPNQNNVLADLNDNLQTVYSSLADLNGVQTNALMRQNDIVNIIDTESGRLESKKQQIDQAAENQKYIINANDNNRKVYAAYLKIAITLTITLAIIWLIRVMNYHFGKFIPNFITNILMIVSVSVGLIVIFNYYRGIRARDPYNFDELKLDPPAPLATPSPDPATAAKLAGGASLCAGKWCCSPSTTWDKVTSQCIVPQGTDGPQGTKGPDVVQSFMTMSSVNPMEAFETYARV